MNVECLMTAIAIVCAIEGLGLLVVANIARRRGNGIGEVVSGWESRHRW